MPVTLEALCAELGMPPMDALPWSTTTYHSYAERGGDGVTTHYVDEVMSFGRAGRNATLTRRRRLEWRVVPGTYKWRVGNKILYEGEDVHGMALGGRAVPDLMNAQVAADKPFSITLDIVVLASALVSAIDDAVEEHGILLPPQDEIFMHDHYGERCGDVACVWQ